MVLYIRYFCSTLHATYLSCMPVTNDILNLKYRFYSLLTLSKYFSALLIFFLNFLFFFQIDVQYVMKIRVNASLFHALDTPRH